MKSWLRSVGVLKMEVCTTRKSCMSFLFACTSARLGILTSVTRTWIWPSGGVVFCYIQVESLPFLPNTLGPLLPSLSLFASPPLDFLVCARPSRKHCAFRGSCDYLRGCFETAGRVHPLRWRAWPPISSEFLVLVVALSPTAIYSDGMYC